MIDHFHFYDGSLWHSFAPNGDMFDSGLPLNRVKLIEPGPLDIVERVKFDRFVENNNFRDPLTEWRF